MIFTNAKKFYALYVSLLGIGKQNILGSYMTRECLTEVIDIIGGTDKSREITRKQFEKDFKIINSVEIYD